MNNPKILINKFQKILFNNKTNNKKWKILKDRLATTLLLIYYKIIKI